MSGSKPYTPDEGLMMRAVDEDDVEGHRSRAPRRGDRR